MSASVLARTVVADVPLSFDNHATRSAANKHYGVMSVDELKKYQFEHDPESCLLLFWATNAALPEALAIVEAWGFQYKGMITWVKPHMGLGNYARNATEQLILATKGKVKVRRHDVLTWFMAEPREHSTKPEHQYELAEALGLPPYLELFARRKRFGWHQIGEQLEGA